MNKMSILTITDLSHQFGEKIIYKQANVQLNKYDHMGITGQNGVGKSTLIKIVTGEILADEGRIEWQKNCKIGYLDQYAQMPKNQTIHEFLLQAYARYFQIEKKIEDIYTEFSHSGNEKLLTRAGQYQTILEESDFYQAEIKIKELTVGLGIEAIGLEKSVGELSGGQRSKIILAKLLLEKPDVLLLDEPTNYLDDSHIQWLSSYLENFKGTFMIVSHDYHFLNKVTNCICDIEFGKFTKYKGNVTQSFKQKENQKEAYLREYQAQQKKIRETEAFIQKYKAGIKSTMARGRQKQLDRLERLTPPGVENRSQLIFPYKTLVSSFALKVNHLVIGYTVPILKPIQLAVHSGEKVALKGFNGVGKSTLVKTLVGELPKLDGKIQLPENTKIGYFSQDLLWEDSNQTPLEYLSEIFPKATKKELHMQLSRAGLSNKLALQSINTLSGGEQTKIKLCELMMTQSNFLILDEPTNHIDQKTKESLGEAVKKYEGTVLIVSHEQTFYEPLVDRILDIEQLVLE